MPFSLIGKKNSAQALRIFFPIMLFVLIGLISGLVNMRALPITALGIFDYLKGFLLIPVFICVSISRRRIIYLYKILYILAIILSLFALLQELAFFLRFPVEKIGVLYPDLVRFGFLRTNSLMEHPNVLGLYTLMFFVLDLNLNRRLRWHHAFLLLGTFLSFSRMVWLASIIVIFFLLIKNRRKILMIVLLSLIICVCVAIPLFYSHTARELRSNNTYRGYTLAKSMEIWKENPLIGVGPGMYGGVVSVMFNSHIYKEYNFSQYWFDYGLRRFRSLDQFWPQILVEMGLIGTLFFMFLLYLLVRIPLSIAFKTADTFKKDLLLGLSVIPLIVFVYLFGSGLNITPILFTYCVLLALIIGTREKGEDVNESTPR
jgi:O-antigen ligase